MTHSIWLICWTALGIGIFHTVTGPDHYLPFVMLAKANRWSRKKLFLITTLCGIGHVLSSIVIGMVGVAGGIALKHLELIESTRGEWAAYGMILFGIAYAIWGLKKGWKGDIHSHHHYHENETHDHLHEHSGEAHVHSHEETDKNRIWWLFIIFVLGPCEPLIPLLIFPAATVGLHGILMVSLVFSLATIATMNLVVFMAFSGLDKVEYPWLERYAHAFAGTAIALSGLAVQFLGL